MSAEVWGQGSRAPYQGLQLEPRLGPVGSSWLAVLCELRVNNGKVVRIFPES